MPDQIRIVISPDGTIHTEVQGVVGPACKELSAWLAKLGQTVDEGATSDAYRADDQVTDAWAQGGV